MKGRKIKAFILTLVMAVAVFGYFTGLNKDLIIYKNEYQKSVALMKSEAVGGVSVESFSSVSTSVTPGEAFDESLLENMQIPDSALSDITTLQYYYETDSYAYGITADGSEVIALRKANGKKYDMLSGAGMVNMLNSSKKTLLSNGGISAFTEGTDENGSRTLTVEYNLAGLVSEENNSAVTVVYIFRENCIDVNFHVIAESESYKFSKANSYLSRNYLCGYSKDNERVKINSKWIYPENLDEPYQDFESLAFIYSPDGVHKFYTFMRDESLNKYQCAYEIFGNKLYNHGLMRFDFTDGTSSLDLEFNYSIAMVDASSENQNPDYLGLFRSCNDDFAAGIALAQDNSERSTIIEGNTANLNINVTNLKNTATTFSLRYDIRNYYGDVVDAGLFVDNILPQNGEANRLIEVSGVYGMYYLNLYVISENSTYKECYPFALVEDHNYTYNATSPFGISTVTSYTGQNKTDYSQLKDLANLSAKIGISNARTSASATKPKYVEYMQELGVTRFIAQQGNTFESLYRTKLDKIKPTEPTEPVETDYEQAEEYEAAYEQYETALAEYEEKLAVYNEQYSKYKAEFLKTVMASADGAATYAQAIEYGNEMNIYNLRDPVANNLDSLYDKFYADTYLPSYTYVKENYPDLEYVPTSFSAAASNWIGRLANNEKSNAIWGQFNICSIHVYGNPRMPDSYGEQSGGSNQTWNIEDAVIRIENACKTYGDKEVYVTEIGYPTSPESTTAAGLRTQADYTLRIGAVCLGHGVDVVQYYCMSDRTGYYTGFNNTNEEWNFGLFYEADYFDVIKPKPAGIAYANMTRQLESYVHNSGKIDSYDEGNLEDGAYSYNVAGVRAFRLDTELYGEVVVAYSNFEVLSNGKKNILGESNLRTPNLTWNTQWQKTDDTEFTAKGETVKVVDIMGNTTIYTPDSDGKVSIPLTGSPVYIYGI